MGIYSNNYQDKQEEILTKESHEAFASWLSATGVKLPITLIHQPQIPSKYLYAGLLAFLAQKMTVDQYNNYLLTIYKDYAIARADVVVSVNGFNLAVGRVFPHKVDIVQKMVNSDIKWRMSHGFAPFEKEDNIIKQYIGFEFTSLPDFMAANEVTLSMFGEKMEKQLTDEQVAVLTDILGSAEDMEKAAEDATARAQEALEGIIPSKAVDMEAVFEQLDIKGLQTALEQLVTEVKTLKERMNSYETDEEEKLDKAISEQYRPQWPVTVESGLEDEELVTELKEKGHVGEQPVSMLNVGFWDNLVGGLNG